MRLDGQISYYPRRSHVMPPIRFRRSALRRKRTSPADKDLLKVLRFKVVEAQQDLARGHLTNGRVTELELITRLMVVERTANSGRIRRRTFYLMFAGAAIILAAAFIPIRAVDFQATVIAERVSFPIEVAEVLEHQAVEKLSLSGVESIDFPFADSARHVGVRVGENVVVSALPGSTLTVSEISIPMGSVAEFERESHSSLFAIALRCPVACKSRVTLTVSDSSDLRIGTKRDSTHSRYSGGIVLTLTGPNIQLGGSLRDTSAIFGRQLPTRSVSFDRREDKSVPGAQWSSLASTISGGTLLLEDVDQHIELSPSEQLEVGTGTMLIHEIRATDSGLQVILSGHTESVRIRRGTTTHLMNPPFLIWATRQNLAAAVRLGIMGAVTLLLVLYSALKQ
jgi:hypothetical protein